MYFDWDEEKNKILEINRGVSFEQIVVEINSGNLLDVIVHPNNKKYPNQLIYIVRSGDYVYCVPFVSIEDKIFLKTIYPSRKFKKIYEKKYL